MDEVVVLVRSLCMLLCFWGVLTGLSLGVAAARGDRRMWDGERDE